MRFPETQKIDQSGSGSQVPQPLLKLIKSAGEPDLADPSAEGSANITLRRQGTF